MPRDPETLRQVNLAIFEAVANYTAAVVLRGIGLSTGICVEFREHSLITTARHAVVGIASDDLRFIPRPRASLRIGSKNEIEALRSMPEGGRYTELPIGRRAETSGVEDLAVLEVGREIADANGFRFYNLDQGSEPREGEEIVLGGIPFELRRPAVHSVTGEFGNAVFPNFEWQQVVTADYPAGDFDPQVHFLLRRERESADGLPEKLGGMSGGGVWRPPSPVPADIVWRPDRIELLGFQIAWAPESGLVKCTPLGVLRSLLEATFPTE